MLTVNIQKPPACLLKKHLTKLQYVKIKASLMVWKVWANMHNVLWVRNMLVNISMAHPAGHLGGWYELWLFVISSGTFNLIKRSSFVTLYMSETRLPSQILTNMMHSPMSSVTKGWERAHHGAQKTYSSVKTSTFKCLKMNIIHAHTITVYKHPLLPCSVVL